MILPLLAAAIVAEPVEKAERAFASMAQTKGQWTAFRAFAAPDAQMVIDGLQPAAPFLKDRKDPPVAVMWWPARTVTSCDGSLALSTGPWRRNGGTTTGRYFTIWRHDAGGWHWVYDGGALDHADTPAGDVVSAKRGVLCHKPVWPIAEPGAVARGASRDDSLRWRLDKAAGGYRFRVFFNTGHIITTEADAIVG